MTIASEINDLKTNLASAKGAIEAAGGTVSNTGLAGLTASIESIPSGGGGTPEGYVVGGSRYEKLPNLVQLMYPTSGGGSLRLEDLPNLTSIRTQRAWDNAIESGGRLSISNLFHNNPSYPNVVIRNLPAVYEIYEGKSSLGSEENYTLNVYDMPNLTSYDMSGYGIGGGNYNNLLSGTYYQFIEDGVSYDVQLIIGKCPNLTNFNIFNDETAAQDFFRYGAALVLYPSMYSAVNNPSYNIPIQSYEGMSQIAPKIREGWILLNGWYNPMGM